MARAFAFAAALLLAPFLAAGMYSSGDAVVQLNEQTMQRLILNSDAAAVVEFYAPWCGHCQTLAPQYKKVAQNLKGIAVVGAVDCDQSDNKRLCAKYNIRGFPTLKLFSGEKQKNPYTGELSKEPTDYQGARTAKPIADAVTALLTDLHITRVATSAELKALQEKRPEVPLVLLFTSKKETSTLAKGLSMQLHKGLAFAEIHESASALVQKYDVEDAIPAVVVVPADGSTAERYSGELKAPQLQAWLQERSVAPKESEDADAGKGGAKGGGAKEAALPELSVAQVAELDAQEDMVLLALVAGKECDKELSPLRRAVADMQEVVRVALVRVEEGEADKVASFSPSLPELLTSEPCTPRLVLLPFGTEKAELDDYKLYEGALEGKALQKWVTDEMPTFPVEVGPESMQAFISSAPQEFTVTRELRAREAKAAGKPPPPPVPPKVVLFTNKEEAPGVFKALALNFRSRAGLGFGWVKTTAPGREALSKQFNPGGKVPALTVALPMPQQGEGGKDLPEEERWGMNVQPYTGPLKYNQMAAWLEQLSKLFEMMAGMAAADGPEGGAAAAGEVLPQISDGASFKEHCGGKGSAICVLGLLQSESASGHAAQREAMLSVATKRVGQGQPFAFAWLDAQRFRSVADAFGVMTSDLPTAVALSPKRMRFAVLRESLSASSVGSFIDGVLGGRVSTQPLQAMPEVVASEGGAAEGEGEGGAEEEIMEPEFDLSDIMSEEVEGTGLSNQEKLKQVEEQLKAEEEARKKAEEEAAKKKKKKSKKKKSKKSSATKEEL